MMSSVLKTVKKKNSPLVAIEGHKKLRKMHVGLEIGTF